MTTKELVQWCKEEGLDIEHITPSKFDNILGEGTGGGMIFGNTGGVMEAALRTVYKVLEKKEPLGPLSELLLHTTYHKR